MLGMLCLKCVRYTPFECLAVKLVLLSVLVDTLDFTTVSEVPEDEELANTFYSQVDDFEDDDSSLSESDSDDEYDDLMERMNDALELKDTLNETSPEKDDLGESLGDSSIMRNKKIESLRR